MLYINYMTKVYIYYLSDPETNEIRYIGQTVKLLKYRLSSHIYDSKRIRNHRTNWIRSIVNKGLKPNIVLIEEVNKSSYIEREKYWIEYYKNLGFNLVNGTIGGEGSLGAKRSDKSKKLLSSSLRKSIGKKVYQYDLDGNFVEEYDTLTDAAKLNKADVSKIASCCKYKRKKHRNYQWSYLKENIGKYINKRWIKND